ncbi:MAG: ligase-associated DNA damage response exonuclease [Acidobacteriota bacterium]
MAMKRDGLITLTPRGLYCGQGGFYIDPWKPVDKAIVTHAHSDHAYMDSRSYLVASEGERLARIRLGDDAKISGLEYGKTVSLNGVKVSLHPAGHILGSAQVRIEHKGETWVVSGDYKLTPDPTCTSFEIVKCHNFITEATFGLPIYRWPPPSQVFSDIDLWWQRNIELGKASVIFAYSLGKAQRILSGVDPQLGPIFTHGAVERLTQAYRESGVAIPKTTYAGEVNGKAAFAGSLIVAPPSAQGSNWLRRFGPQSTAFASGWMIVRGARRQRAIDRGFVLSDHADWPELLSAIHTAEAENVYVTHGFSEEVVRYLNDTGGNAYPLKTRFVGDDADMSDEGSDVPTGK